MQIEVSYNFFLVFLSFSVSVFGSFTSIQLIKGINNATQSAKPWWVFFAALALGGGTIWTMHFIGMLAYQSPMPITYHTGLTFLSLAIAILIVGVGIHIVSEASQSIPRLLIAGNITGLGVASMHYMGMAAMIMAADIKYDYALLVLSIIIAIFAATAALWLAFNLNGNINKLISAFVMGIAVCGMHYTGMAAMTMTPNNRPISAASSIEPLTMGLFIFCFSMLLLALCLIVALSQMQKRMYADMHLNDAPM